MTDLNDVVTQMIQDQPAVQSPPVRQLRHRAAARRRKWVAAAAFPALLVPALGFAIVSREAPTESSVASEDAGPIRDKVIRIEACPGGAPRPDLVCGSTEDPSEIERLTNLLNRAQPVDKPPCQQDRDGRVSVVFFYAVDATPVNVYEPECALIDEDLWGKQLRMSEEFVRKARALLRPQTEFPSKKPGCLGMVDDLDELTRGLGNWPPLDKDMQDDVSRLETRMRTERDLLTPEQRAVTERLTEGTYGDGAFLNSILLGGPADTDDRLRQALQELRNLCPSS